MMWITPHGSRRATECVRAARITPYSCHPWWAVERLFLVVSSFWLSPCVSPAPCSSLPTSTCTLTWTPSYMVDNAKAIIPCASANWGVLLSGRIHSSHTSSFTLPSNHYPRTRSTIGTTRSSPRTPRTSCTSPCSPSRQAAPSRITLAWKPAEWRKPAHDNSHRLWAQRACDCLEDRRLSWRSISIIWCTERIWRRSAPSSDHRRSEGIWRNCDTQRAGF